MLRQKRKCRTPRKSMEDAAENMKRRSSSLEETRPRSKHRDSRSHRRTRSSGSERAECLHESGARPKNRDSLGSTESRRRSSGASSKRNVSHDTRQDEYAQRRREHKKQKHRLQKHLIKEVNAPVNSNDINNAEENVSVC